ncbi:MAG: hypothetical protein HC828_02040 [Blastochloris sp.]|nr:hypothetical protein [Blastochloris sp.]
MTERTFKNAFVDEPLRLIAAQPAQVGISALSILLTAIYFAAPLLEIPWLHPYLVYIVTAMAALGVEWAFLKGVADRAYIEAHGGKPFWGDVLVYTTGGLLVVGGTTVLLTYVYRLEIFTNPGDYLAAFLAVAHVAPLAAIGVCSAQLHAAAERLAVRYEQERRRTLDDRRADIDMEVYAAEQKAYARQRVQAARDSHAPRTADDSHGSHAAAERGDPLAQERAAVREAYERDPKFNRSDLARQIGKSEAWVRKVVKLIEAEKE